MKMFEIIKDNVIEIFSQPIVLIIGLIGVLLTMFYSKIIGFFGEFWVKRELEKLPKDKYIILNDLLISDYINTHQIDHVVISKNGIFVIETKNYDGLIIGKEYSDKWVQYLGKSKFYFNNPIHQNYGHIKVLQSMLNLGKNSFISIICFSNRSKLRINLSNVTQVDFLKDLILSYQKEVVFEDINIISDKLTELNITDKKIRKRHIERIKNKLKVKEENKNKMICPKCGNKLVERNGKNGVFVGCSNFPKCKYTKNK